VPDCVRLPPLCFLASIHPLDQSSPFMFLDPESLQSVAPAEILKEATAGLLGIDRRFFRALLSRPEETVAAVLAWANRDHEDDPVNLEIEVIELIHALKIADGIPFLLDAIRVAPDDIPDEVIEAIHSFGADSIEPLLDLYKEIGEEDGAEVAFLLASLHVRDPRILDLLLDRLEFDAAEGAFLLGIYGDPQTRPALEKMAAGLGDTEEELKKDIENALGLLTDQPPAREDKPFDLLERYPEKTDPPIDLLPEHARIEFLHHPSASVRAEAAHSFFNRELDTALSSKLLSLAKSDEDVAVRARAWESLNDATDRPEVVEAMLAAMRDSSLPVQERASVLVGLSLEADRNEVRAAMDELYENAEARAKTLEAMWRSVHPSFRERFAPNLDHQDVEVRRNAIWGVGYFGVRSSLDKLRGFFEDEELRPDALFAYTLAIPGETTKGRVRTLFNRVEKDAGGLSAHEQELVKAALDERLALAGKEPYFTVQA
jgi:HEAT repeat protein